MKVISFLSITAVLISGCASGPQFQQADTAPDGKATVYLYRPKQIVGWGGLIPVNSPYSIYLNGTNRIELYQGGYCVYYVPAGTNFFSSELISPSWVLNAILKEKNLFQTNFETSETYYLKFEVGATRAKVKMMDAQTGLQEVRNYKQETP